MNYLATATSIIAILVSTAAHAQDGSIDPKMTEASAQNSGDIVVTALRKETSLQKTPISISAFSEDFLESNNIISIADLYKQVPNMNLSDSGSGTSRLSIRGIQVAGEPTVGLYYDETSVYGPSGSTQDPGAYSADLNLFDVSRVEVLRGPQGTLYGASAMSGALRVIFNKPDATKFDGAAEIQYESANSGSEGWALRGMVNVPIIQDKLAIRITGSRDITPGYIDNVYHDRANTNEIRSAAIRTSLRWTPSENFDVTGKFIWQKKVADDLPGWFERLGKYKNDSPVFLPFSSDMKLYDLTANWHNDAVNVSATISHYDWDVERNVDLTGLAGLRARSPAICAQHYGYTSACTPAQMVDFGNYARAQLPVIGYQPLQVANDSAELRMFSDSSDSFQWTIGGFYQERADRIDSYFSRGSYQTGAMLNPAQHLAYRFIETKLQQKALFAELTYELMEGLKATAGIRRYYYKKSTAGAVVTPDVLVGVTPSPYSEVTANAKGWLGRGNLNYQVNPDVMLYASAGEGFRPGGANNVPGLIDTLVAYEPDKLWTYEIGAKTKFLDNAVTANMAVFRTDWSNLQVSAMSATGPFNFISNAGSARVEGAELELTARPAMGFAFNLAVGYVNGRLREDQTNNFIAVTGSSGKKGDRLPNSPRWTIAGGAEYRWDVGHDFEGLIRADGYYRSKMNSSYRKETDPYFESYGGPPTFDLRAGITSEKLDVTLYVKNLTNKVVLTSALSSVLYERVVASNLPRVIGITTRIGF